jgi:hypothetical protein
MRTQLYNYNYDDDGTSGQAGAIEGAATNVRRGKRRRERRRAKERQMAINNDSDGLSGNVIDAVALGDGAASSVAAS